MNTNGAGRIILRIYTVFYWNIFRSIGQAGKMEFDEIGQRGMKVHLLIDLETIEINRKIPSAVHCNGFRIIAVIC